jgi:hypothetical protein
MKKATTILSLSLFCFVLSGKAQIQRGNLLVGTDIANFDLGLNSGNGFNVLINPSMAYFIRDGLAVGPFITLGISGSKDIQPTTMYGIGALGRYYVSDTVVSLLKHGRFFVEGNAGIEGNNNSQSNETTNGLGLGFGPGYAYFITENIGLETLLKYNGIIGFGSSATTSTLHLSFGFQIYIGSQKAKEAIQNQ